MKKRDEINILQLESQEKSSIGIFLHHLFPKYVSFHLVKFWLRLICGRLQSSSGETWLSSVNLT